MPWRAVAKIGFISHEDKDFFERCLMLMSSASIIAGWAGNGGQKLKVILELEISGQEFFYYSECKIPHDIGEAVGYPGASSTRSDRHLVQIR